MVEMLVIGDWCVIVSDHAPITNHHASGVALDCGEM
jgi:hypothetical protein